MNSKEAMSIVHNRIQQYEQEYALKIFGYLLVMQDNGDCDMIRLAFCPDPVLMSVIECVKLKLLQTFSFDHIPLPPPPSSASPPIPFASTRTGFWDHSTDMDHQFLNFQESINTPDFSNNGFCPRGEHRVSRRRSPSLPEFPVKICHYFLRGICKHGNNCRYFHGQEMFNSPRSGGGVVEEEEQVVSPGSLEKLEGEIIELLKSRKGAPISIASLPTMYYEKYGRILQAEGYLTESQRHGKAGYSLTKLLARLNNTIRLIDKPHGQHSVILAEDESKFPDYTGERNDHGAILAGSRQIYLTFPAESSFTEHDVSNYFSQFGHVEDVRIPCQQKRMFGFVTFVYTETVKHILAKGNPHFICDARVLVKPYREKSRCSSSRYFDNNNNKPFHGMRYGSSQYFDRDLEMNTMPPRASESSRLSRKHYQEQSMSKSLPTNYSYFGLSSNDFKLPKDEHEEQAERLSYLLDYLNTEDNVMKITTNYRENDRRIRCESLDNQVLNLPESPFSSLSGQEISTVT
ncbi:unnamed protein product [Cochlearia groenlandica]